MNNNYMKIHPLWVVLEIYKLIRNILALYIFCAFVLKKIIFINTYVYLIIIIIIFFYSLSSIILSWVHFKFKLDYSSIDIITGKIIKNKRHIPLDSVIGYSEKSSLWERIFKLSSIEIKIKTTNNDKRLVIPIISKENANQIKKYLDSVKLKDSKDMAFNYYNLTRYTMKKDQLIKGGLSSVSLVLFILFLYSLYEKVNDYITFDVNNIFNTLEKSNYYIFIILILLIVLSNIYSVTKTFIKYGEFELFLNSKDIHTTWGTFSKNNNTISKNHISAFILKASYLQQAFKINQLSVINMDSSKEKNSVNIIMPYSNIEQSIKILSDITNKKISFNNMHKIPFSGLISKILRTFFAWFTLTVFMYIFNETWYIFAFLILIIFSNQLLKSLFSKIKYDDQEIIKQQQGFTKEIFITNFHNISEIQLKESFVQKFLGVSTLKIFCQATPLYKISIYDISNKDAYNIINIFKKSCENYKNL